MKPNRTLCVCAGTIAAVCSIAACSQMDTYDSSHPAGSYEENGRQAPPAAQPDPAGRDMQTAPQTVPNDAPADGNQVPSPPVAPY